MNPQVRVNFSAYSPAINFVQTNNVEPSRTLGIGDNLCAGFNSEVGIESINGADPLMNHYYRQLTEAWNIPRAWNWRFLVDEKALVQLRPLFDMLNVRYFLGSSARGSEEGLRLAGRFDLSVYQSDSAWPRAFFVEGVSAYQPLPQLVSLV